MSLLSFLSRFWSRDAFEDRAHQQADGECPTVPSIVFSSTDYEALDCGGCAPPIHVRRLGSPAPVISSSHAVGVDRE